MLLNYTMITICYSTMILLPTILGQKPELNSNNYVFLACIRAIVRTGLYIISLFLVICAVPLQGQSVADQGCGTAGDFPSWLAEYLESPHSLKARSADEVIYLPLAVHSVGKTNGEGHYSTQKIFESICRLNKDFEPYNIQFYLKGAIQKINRDLYYEHDNFGDGFQMMQSFKKSLAINTFITSTAPRDACGYYHTSADAIVVTKNCMGPSGHTWTHEVGHWLSLPHTFSGWEEISYDPTKETPHFLKVQGRDTIYVENVSGSNCHKAGDRFCDTSPDYLSVGWSCNPSSSESLIVQKDPTGSDFRSDGANFMSYSSDVCQSEFSKQQVDAMKAYIDFSKPFYVNHNPPLNIVPETPVLGNFPTDGDKLHYQSIKLEWQHQTNATHYLIQISRFSFFAVIDYEFTSDANFINIGDLPVDKKYYWRIMPYNAYDLCSGYTDMGEFSTYDVTAVEEVGGDNFVEIFPTILTSESSTLNIRFEFQEILETRLQLRSLSGQLVLERQLVNPGHERVQISLQDLPSGMYVLLVETPKGRLVKKVTVQQ